MAAFLIKMPFTAIEESRKRRRRTAGEMHYRPLTPAEGGTSRGVGRGALKAGRRSVNTGNRNLLKQTGYILRTEQSHGESTGSALKCHNG